MEDSIPDKGKVLTQISMFWFEKMKSIIDNHVITADISKMPEECQEFAKDLDKRTMLVKKQSHYL
jgi:Phosphoribosylaminoimidazolesuccinocarboxamide (SAICAR) synthase